MTHLATITPKGTTHVRLQLEHGAAVALAIMSTLQPGEGVRGSQPLVAIAPGADPLEALEAEYATEQMLERLAAAHSEQEKVAERVVGHIGPSSDGLDVVLEVADLVSLSGWLNRIFLVLSETPNDPGSVGAAGGALLSDDLLNELLGETEPAQDTSQAAPEPLDLATWLRAVAALLTQDLLTAHHELTATGR